MSADGESLLHELVGDELAVVAFVRDYLQLTFDSGLLSMYTWPEVNRASVRLKSGDSGYRDALCALIGQPVINANESSDQGIAISWKSTSMILNPSWHELTGPEIALLKLDGTSLRGEAWQVWRLARRRSRVLVEESDSSRGDPNGELGRLAVSALGAVDTRRPTGMLRGWRPPPP